jgi:predicted secreted Zn-dependent protease
MNSPQETHRAVALVAVATERAEPEIIVRFKFKYFVGEVTGSLGNKKML